MGIKGQPKKFIFLVKFCLESTRAARYAHKFIRENFFRRWQSSSGG